MIALSPSLRILHQKLHFHFPGVIPKRAPEVPTFESKLEEYIGKLNLYSYTHFLRMLDIKKADFILNLSKKFSPGDKEGEAPALLPGRTPDVWGRSISYNLCRKKAHNEILDFIYTLGFTYSMEPLDSNKNILTIYEGEKDSYSTLLVSEINNYFKKHLSSSSEA